MEFFSGFFYTLVQREDSIFCFILFLSAAVFLVGEVLWILRKQKPTAAVTSVPPDDTRFSALWTIVPAVILVLLAFVQAGSTSQHRRASAPTKAKIALERVSLIGPR